MERDIIQYAALSSPPPYREMGGWKGGSNLHCCGGGNPLGVLERELRHVHPAHAPRLRNRAP
jgi:hypothetical protein